MLSRESPAGTRFQISLERDRFCSICKGYRDGQPPGSVFVRVDRLAGVVFFEAPSWIARHSHIEFRRVDLALQDVDEGHRLQSAFAEASAGHPPPAPPFFGNLRANPSRRSLRRRRMERVKGIEPSYSAWKAAALPLSYTRVPAAMPGHRHGFEQVAQTGDASKRRVRRSTPLAPAACDISGPPSLARMKRCVPRVGALALGFSGAESPSPQTRNPKP